MKYWISIGSNIEPRLWYIRKALEIISEIAEIKKVSSVYESESFGFESHDFLNICSLIETDLMPETLVRFFKRVETMLGRDPKTTYASRFFYEPRPVDIDVIFWEQGTYEKGDIVIPHPQSHRRKFVLIPLIEMREDIVHPTLMKRLSEILSEIEDDSWIIKVFYEI
ncbi:MAG: 2-amino-4-hydroxy-6-hydroxymethyldihydropteridine diphosphokinase [Candidatus Calescibacterium sp.]|nr:2-amino-4-hydroxy-6-hydroxymethyldihydropteridine diphosphokinase [Candidatus Calescibacterium sp.]MCX7733628.1 2-amino-4-hydroxy-6-hydroxymethyldihydropteridine diphosphokinase [bacterium]MDW8087187.1 2-amino-4-hydroxy-6-hydroxymethyldihydropteridine diphosphokinase [Candidatus Calescibacterium sp.]